MGARGSGFLAKAPRWATVSLWVVATVMVAAEAAHDVLGLGGPGSDRFFDDVLHNAALWLAAGLCLWAAVVVDGSLEPRARPRIRAAWTLTALALAVWAAGETIWSLRFGGERSPPSATFSDVLWLAWYPLIAGAVVIFVRERVPRFELHRWMDGLVVMLVTASLWVALFLQPVDEKDAPNDLTAAVAFAYPLGDFVLVGGVLGVYALLGWRLGRMWILLGLGLAVIGIADAASSAATLAAAPTRGDFDAWWSGCALLVAAAAWQTDTDRPEEVEVSGLRSIALPLAAQALAIAIQVYGYFRELPRSERLLTTAVLIIAMVQIVLTRPRRGESRRGAPDR